jgi:phytoene dehydrogenase-like protein
MDRRLNNHKMRQLPQSYEVVEQGNDLIKFVAVTRFYGDVFDADPRDFEDEDDGVAEIVRRKPRPAYIDFEKLDAERQRAERERERAMNEMLQEIREANEW